MEFKEVMSQFMRLCDSFANCDNCPVFQEGFSCENDHQGYSKTGAEDLEHIIMQWAAEHPEPQYPTWAEWLLKVGAARRVPIGEPWPVELADCSMLEPCYEIVVKENERIPAYIAEPLGIEPKEG